MKRITVYANIIVTPPDDCKDPDAEILKLEQALNEQCGLMVTGRGTDEEKKIPLRFHFVGREKASPVEEPKIILNAGLDMHVCVPDLWSDEKVIAFCEQKNPCGTEGGWGIRRAGDKRLWGMPERNPCDTRDGYVHMVLEA